MTKFFVFCLMAFFGFSAWAIVVPDDSRPSNTLDCTPTSKSGLVSVDLRPDFNSLGAQVTQRLVNIVTLMGPTSPNPKIEIFYELAAPYDPLKKTVFLSEGFYPKLTLNFVVIHFPELAQKYNLLQIHFRGSGCSKAPPGISPLYYTHEMIAADLEKVRSHLQINKLYAWGSGSGSFVMLSYAMLFPDHVDRVFLRDAAVRAPSLKESSDYFKQNLLPELLSPKENQILQQLSATDPLAYTTILKYVATAFLGGAREMAGTIINQGSSLISKGGSSVLLDYIEDTLGQAPSWSEAVTANECLGANEDYDQLDPQDVLIIPYAFHRCQVLQKNHPQPLVEPLNFTGLLRGLRNPFFIYQGYWDVFTIRPLAEQLKSELPNSQLFIEPRVGQGEITPETLPCLGELLDLFFAGESQEKIALYLEQNCK